jgi:anthranilate synthase/aminodeoxychorismate synthase-like glutamine amidotransferase
MLLLIDNYDSFTWNLVQLVETVAAGRYPGLAVRVVRNDQINADEALALAPSHLIVSPGPCTPRQAGASGDIIARLAAEGIPTLGVCLGHQCIAERHGGIVERAARLMHGKTDQIHHDGRGLFAGMPDPFTATRYHSLIVRPGSLDERDFEVTAWTGDREIMGLRHRRQPLEGVQFHPESFLTEHGQTLMLNFLAMRPRNPGGV